MITPTEMKDHAVDFLLWSFRLILFLFALAALIFVLQSVASNAADNLSPCLSYKQARARYPDVHLWWHYDEDKNKCWSNRRGGPRRHMDPNELKPISIKSVRWYPRPFEHTEPVDPPILIVVPDSDECCWPELSDFDKRFTGQ
jgi:hypothetical protein